MTPYRILYMGNWGQGLAGLRALLDHPSVQIVQVYSKFDLAQDNPFLNGVYRAATAAGLPVVQSSKDLCSKKAFVDSILQTPQVDFLMSCCFDRMFPAAVLAHPKKMAINVHPSFLPRLRGEKPIENALARGEKDIGVTIHQLVAQIDAGDILHQKSWELLPTTTLGEAYDRQSQVAAEVIREFFNDADTFLRKRRPQDESLATLAPRLPFVMEDRTTAAEAQRLMAAHGGH
jgi:methionyl-tRNA formyltransferase